MTVLSRIPARTDPDELLRWYAASWADYLACCEQAEREQPDSFRIFSTKANSRSTGLEKVLSTLASASC